MVPSPSACGRFLFLALLPVFPTFAGAVVSPPSSSVDAPASGKTPTVQVIAELGRAMFFDRALSASGQMACATCHDPAHAYGPPNDRSVQLGGPKLQSPGLRAVPSLRYLQTVPSFTEHYFEEVRGDVDQGPAGGRTWDGRAGAAADQARAPLLSPFEMANASLAEVTLKVSRARYAPRFRAAFGQGIFEDSARAQEAILECLQVFQESPADFYPYTSKYDAFLRGQVQLSPRELRGKALFDGPAKGGCASCHPDDLAGGAFPQFTDYGYVAVGVPRNSAIPANKNPKYHDLGLCGPLRTDYTGRREYCGLFRAPSLRNSATRHVFFHNGVFHSLQQVLEFYVERDTNPAKWYPRDAQGQVEKFNDLPEAYRGNVSTEPPFDRHPGDAPALSKAEIKDLIAFLATLTDRDVASGVR